MSSQAGAKKNIFSEVPLPNVLELDSESPGRRGEERHEANVCSQLDRGPISGLGSLQFVDTSHFYVIEKFIFPLQKNEKKIETLKAVRKWNCCPLLSSLSGFWFTQKCDHP